MEKKMIQAQAQLLQRASILMVAGVNEKVTATCHPFINLFNFGFADVDLFFDDEHPYNDEDVNAAINKLDKMIDQHYKAAQFAVSVIKTWKGE